MEENLSFSKYGKCIVVLLMLLCIKANAQDADIDLLRSINGHRNASRDAVMEGATNSVYPIAAAVPIAQLIFGYGKHDKKTIACAWQSIEGLGLNALLTFTFKDVVNRPRPYITYTGLNPYERLGEASFPSGHTSFAFTTATTLSLEYRKWYIVVPAYLWAGTAGLSRMYLGMHYPSDVLGGAIIGTGSAWLSYKAQKWLNLKYSKADKKKNSFGN